MMWLNWQKWIKISSVFKMKLTTILNINLHRYNEHVRSVWSHLVDNLYYRLSEVFLTQALAIWSCEIFLNSKLVACKYLNLLSVFSGEPRASLKKKAVYLEFPKAFALLPPGLMSRWQIVSSSDCSILTHLSMNSAPDHAGVIQGLSDSALQKDRLTCPSQSFPVGLENWEAYCFSLSFKKLWITKNYQHASFSECHFFVAFLFG